MISSVEYWKNRYEDGGHSGLGSYGFLAKYKKNFINKFIKEKHITSLLEYGCGDGNQLVLIDCKIKYGVDVSKTAIEKCINLMPESKFFVVSENEELFLKKTDLLLSLDVLYHLLEDEVFENYLKNIVEHGSDYVIIYSSDFEDNEHFSKHVRHRKFSNHPILLENYDLINIEENLHKSTDHELGSFSDWFIYKKK